jgi:hypothetical protein
MPTHLDITTGGLDTADVEILLHRVLAGRTLKDTAARMGATRAEIRTREVKALRFLGF